MTKRIKVAVLTQAGGAHLSAYFESLAQAEEVESVVLADPSGQSEMLARKLLQDRLTKVSTSAADLLRDEQPQLALISMEAAESPAAINTALDAGCHVLAEKPACVRAEDFEKLVEKADSKHLQLVLALANRVNPPIREARRLIQTGALGKIYGLEMHLIADQTRLKSPAYHKGWFASRSRAGGGNLIWLGIHWVDLAVYLTGSRVAEVTGFAGNVGGQPIDVEDSAAVALRFDNGTFGTLTAGYYLDRGYHSHIKIWGSLGWLHLEPKNELPLRSYSTKPGSPEGPQNYSGPKGPEGYPPFVREVVRSCAGLQEPPLTAADSLHALRAVFGLYAAAEKGQTQRVK